MQISFRAVQGEGGHKKLQNNTKIAKDYKSGIGKLQILNMHIVQCTLHIAQVTRQDKTIEAILAELNYKSTDFDLDNRYIS